MLFVILIEIILLGASFTSLRDRKKKKYLLFLVFTLGTIMLCLRNVNVGIDTKNYFSTFSGVIQSDSWSYKEYPETLEPLYFYSIKVLGTIIPSPYFVNIVFGILTMVAFGTFIYRFSNDVVLSSMIFFSSFFFSTFNIMRQYLGIAFILYAIMGAVRGKKIMACIMLLFGGLIHYSVLFFFPFLIILFIYKTNSVKKTVFLSIIAIASLSIMTYIIDIVITLIPKYSRFFEVSGNMDLRATDVSFAEVFLWIIQFVLIISWIIKKYKLQKQNMKEESVTIVQYESDNIMYAMTVINISEFVIWIVASQMWIASRFETLFSFASIITFPFFLAYFFYKTKIKVKNGYTMVRICFIAYYFILCIRYIVVDPHQIFPYTFLGT